MLSTLPSGWEAWADAWEPALECWSKFTRLHQPRFCIHADEAKQQGMPEEIFAMIRLFDHEVVLSLPRIEACGVKLFPKEILAHEIGHHVYCPGNLTDNGRLMARLRAGLPTVEQRAPTIANLYADLLINDRLQRLGLDMAGVYRAIRAEGGKLWTFYMRSYEVLWNLPRGVLVVGETGQSLDVDAQLCARLIRAYAADWLRGAGRFAALALPYVMSDSGSKAMAAWLDTQKSGEGGTPDGLTEMDDDEDAEVVHPALDPELSGVEPLEEIPEGADGSKARTRPDREFLGGKKRTGRYRGPLEYGELLQALGTGMSEDDIAAKYYRERALPHLIRFPRPVVPEATELTPEGLSTWDIGSPLARADWIQSVIRSPRVVPGVTTLARRYGASPAQQKGREPVDLYIGIDCSGSMPNPRRDLSYPVLAGAIVGLSALRAGARVEVVLSGEPGQSISTHGFVAEARAMLGVLTDYLGTGYSFGIGRLRDAFPAPRRRGERKVHILLITDQDIFSMLENPHRQMKHEGRATDEGWSIARDALMNAGGGGTCVLNMPRQWRDGDVDRLVAQGWSVHRLYDWEELVAFAREFSRQRFDVRQGKTHAGRT